MLRHLFKLVWNRRRANALLAAEIFIAFLVVFAIISNALYLRDLQQRPLGFDVENIWSISAQRPGPRAFAAVNEEDSATLQRLAREIEALSPVEMITMGTDRPYGDSSFMAAVAVDGQETSVERATVTPSFLETMGLELVDGRFLEKGDKLLDPTPIVVTQSLAKEVFGRTDVLDEVLDETRRETRSAYRIVGVVSAYRHRGDFGAETPFFFEAGDANETGGFLLGEIHIRLSPETTAAFEEQLEKLAESIAPRWNFEINPLARSRETKRQAIVVPLALGAIVAGFLLLMVVLGVTGVLWQNVTRRTREMGLRRALGATRGAIHRQVVGESLILSALAVAAGCFVAVQLPITGLLPEMTAQVVLASAGLAAALVLSLAAACGLYPGLGATRIAPAQALHFE